MFQSEHPESKSTPLLGSEVSHEVPSRDARAAGGARSPRPRGFAAPSLAGTQLNPYEQQLVKYVNQERAKQGSPEAQGHAALVAAARAHSADMGDRTSSSSTTPSTASTFADRIIAAGYEP